MKIIDEDKKNQLIVRKNVRSKKGTKRWKHQIDVSGLEQAIAQQNEKQAREQAKKLLEQKQRNTKDGKKKSQGAPVQDTLTFQLSTQQPPAQSAKRAPLDPDRFVKKDPITTSKYENQKILKLAKKEAVTANSAPKQNDDAHAREEQLEDLWADENTNKSALPLKIQKIRSANAVGVARIVAPPSGTSYNPSFKAHQALLDDIVRESDIAKEAKRAREDERLQKERDQHKIEKLAAHLQRLKKEKKARAKPKSVKEALAVEVAHAKQREKQLNHQFLLIKKYQKEIKKTQEETALKQQLRQNAIENEKANNKLGIVQKSKKIGKKQYKMKPEAFQLEDELAENLRHLSAQTDNLVRDSFDSIFRRGLIETPSGRRRSKAHSLLRYKQKLKYKAEGDEFDQIEKQLE